MATERLDVVIIGGSLAGLMHGVMIKRLGHNVRILEQYPTSIREGQAAGMSTGVHGQEFLKKHDLVQQTPRFVTASYLRVFGPDLKLLQQRKVPFKLTDWKTFYYRLRSNFDGLISEYVPESPQKLPAEGSVTYETDKTVVDVSHHRTSGLTVTFQGDDGLSHSLHADLVIAADGANSSVRKLLFPKLNMPYSGYLTWRGVVLERDVSVETRSFFHDQCIRYRYDRSYIVIYIIPGEHGSITPGERHLNLVWYYNCAEGSDEYNKIMTDIDGLRHKRTVPFGKLQPEVWVKQRDGHSTHFPTPVKEVLDKIDSPFVTAISDCIAPQASFYEGKLFLVGDALALFRPHVAQSTNQAALHCLLLEKYLQGEITLATYEERVQSYAHTTLLWSRDLGSEYMYGRMGQIYHKTRHQVARKAKGWGFRL
ncbi:2,6-dihydroxypyridine 3-monooxygenase [Lachnellula arida]|uniref:2,6-dihydroxypyridine 3-monooxygenase n=1 Tax=Lachnellula arida TaxID=1316785 RepID=A0A8T9B7Y7_9HELO|nr:2,6-dihydroxypyridine 3-monooxygenase [Lachnellula arida]